MADISLPTSPRAHTAPAAQPMSDRSTAKPNQDRGPAIKDKAATRDQVHAAPGRHDRIATRAYFLSEQRGTLGGCPLQDWLQAERQDEGDQHTMLRFPDMDHRG
jgi:hypothetical protein